MTEYLENTDQTSDHEEQPPAQDRILMGALTAASLIIQSQAAMLDQRLAHEADLYERLAVERERREMAERDSKTELLQHEAWLRQVGHAVMLGGRETDTGHHSIMLLDLDSFKTINDTIGHLRTDRVLHRIADCIRDCTREEDILGRFGGDELTVFLGNTSVDNAVRVGERIQRSMLLIRPDFAGLQQDVTASIGIAELRSGGYTESAIAIALAAADKAVFDVKENGRNGIMVGVAQPEITPDS